MKYITRLATLNDIDAITEIYNQGIEDRVATLETKFRTPDDMREWFLNRSDRYKVVVITDEIDSILGWASLNVFNSRCCYSGIVDISIYIARHKRGKGLGKQLLNYLIGTAKQEGFHKLVLSMLSFNEAGKKLYLSAGFREVGTYIKQGLLDGKWVDVTIMEKLLI